MEEQSLINVCSVGETALSAFLSWRLRETNMCDVTLVWSGNHFREIESYGITFKSPIYGEQRFKLPVVPSITDLVHAEQSQIPKFEYVILAPSSREDARKLIAQARDIATPQHTCIVLDISKFTGLESIIRQTFPQNIVLSFFSTVDVGSTQDNTTFYSGGRGDLNISPLSAPHNLPLEDILGALSDTLSLAGGLECKHVNNVYQLMFETIIPDLAFHPTSVLFDTIHYGDLFARVGVRETINSLFKELSQLAAAFDCSFGPDYQDKLVNEIVERSREVGRVPNPLWDTFRARTRMDLAKYFDLPMSLAKVHDVPLPQTNMMYALLHHRDVLNTRAPPPRPNLPSRNASMQRRPPPPTHMPNSRPWSKSGPPMTGSDTRLPLRGPPRRALSKLTPNEVAHSGMASVGSSMDSLPELYEQSHHYPSDSRRMPNRSVDTPQGNFGPIDRDEGIDMLSLTSRRTRAFRMSSNSAASRPVSSTQQIATVSDAIMNDIPSLQFSLRDSALFRNCSSNRYGTVDRIESERVSSRANSISSKSGWYPNQHPSQRRISPSPARAYGSSSSRVDLSADGIDYKSPLGPRMMMEGGKLDGAGRYPSTTDLSSHPMPSRALGSNHLYENKDPHNRSLTGSASASAGSGESTLDSPAQSSSSSLNKMNGTRPVVGVR